jgi:hypothetical protein
MFLFSWRLQIPTWSSSVAVWDLGSEQILTSPSAAFLRVRRNEGRFRK